MVKKQGGKLACGQCHKFFNEDELRLGNERYLCDGCYEPRDDPDPDAEKCEECGEYKGDCECDKDIDDDDIEIDGEDKEELNPVRAIRGEARAKHAATRIKRERPTEKEKGQKSLISW